jgi:hypothetical protein
MSIYDSAAGTSSAVSGFNHGFAAISSLDNMERKDELAKQQEAQSQLTMDHTRQVMANSEEDRARQNNLRQADAIMTQAYAEWDGGNGKLSDDTLTRLRKLNPDDIYLGRLMDDRDFAAQRQPKVDAALNNISKVFELQKAAAQGPPAPTAIGVAPDGQQQSGRPALTEEGQAELSKQKSELYANMTDLTKDRLLVGMADDGQPKKDARIVGAEYSPDGKGVAIEVEITRQDGSKYVAPITQNRTADPKDPVKFIPFQQIFQSLNNEKMVIGSTLYSTQAKFGGLDGTKFIEREREKDADSARAAGLSKKDSDSYASAITAITQTLKDIDPTTPTTDVEASLFLAIKDVPMSSALRRDMDGNVKNFAARHKDQLKADAKADKPFQDSVTGEWVYVKGYTKDGAPVMAKAEGYNPKKPEKADPVTAALGRQQIVTIRGDLSRANSLVKDAEREKVKAFKDYEKYLKENGRPGKDAKGNPTTVVDQTDPEYMRLHEATVEAEDKHSRSKEEAASLQTELDAATGRTRPRAIQPQGAPQGAATPGEAIGTTPGASQNFDQFRTWYMTNADSKNPVSNNIILKKAKELGVSGGEVAAIASYFAKRQSAPAPAAIKTSDGMQINTVSAHNSRTPSAAPTPASATPAKQSTGSNSTSNSVDSIPEYASNRDGWQRRAGELSRESLKIQAEIDGMGTLNYSDPKVADKKIKLQELRAKLKSNHDESEKAHRQSDVWQKRIETVKKEQQAKEQNAKAAKERAATEAEKVKKARSATPLR